MLAWARSGPSTRRPISTHPWTRRSASRRRVQERAVRTQRERAVDRIADRNRRERISLQVADAAEQVEARDLRGGIRRRLVNLIRRLLRPHGHHRPAVFRRSPGQPADGLAPEAAVEIIVLPQHARQARPVCAGDQVSDQGRPGAQRRGPITAAHPEGGRGFSALASIGMRTEVDLAVSLSTTRLIGMPPCNWARRCRAKFLTQTPG